MVNDLLPRVNAVICSHVEGGIEARRTQL